MQSCGSGRPMSDVEYGYHVFSRNELWLLVRTLIVECDCQLDINDVNNALVALMKWNPILRMAIEKKSDGKWYFNERLDAKPRLVCLENEKNWLKIMRKEMSNPLGDDSAPQFRCTFLPNINFNTDDSGNWVNEDGDKQWTNGKKHESKYGEEKTKCENIEEKIDNNTKQICAFIFTIDHCIIDGVSAIAMLKKFYSLLCDIKSDVPVNNISTPWPHMFPSCEFYVNKAFENLKHEENGVEKQNELKSIPQFSLDFFQQTSSLYTDVHGTEFSKADKDIPYETSVIVKSFSQAKLSKLLTACRENNSTVQGFLQVACSIACALVLQTDECHLANEQNKIDNENTKVENKSKEYLINAEQSVDNNMTEAMCWKDFTIHSYAAANLRKYICPEIPDDYIGFYISLIFDLGVEVKQSTLTSSAEFWTLAQNMTKYVKNYLIKKKYIDTFYGFKGFGKPDMKINIDEFKTPCDGRLHDMLYATTLGSWEFMQGSVVKPLAVYLGSSIHRSGPIFHVHVVTINGTMFCSISFSRRIVSQSKASKFAISLTNVLKQFCGF